MAYLKNNKALVFIIGVLLLSNVALLYFFIKKDEKKQQFKTPREWMIHTLKTEVGFSDGQITQYEQLSDKHKESMKSLFDGITKAKDSLYKLLLQPSVPDSLTSHYLVMIGERQKEIDQKIFNHFLSLREVCTPEQRPKYDSVIQRIIRKMISPPKKGGEKEKDKK